MIRMSANIINKIITMIMMTIVSRKTTKMNTVI